MQIWSFLDVSDGLVLQVDWQVFSPCFFSSSVFQCVTCAAPWQRSSPLLQDTSHGWWVNWSIGPEWISPAWPWVNCYLCSFFPCTIIFPQLEIDNKTQILPPCKIPPPLKVVLYFSYRALFKWREGRFVIPDLGVALRGRIKWYGDWPFTFSPTGNGCF